MSPVYVTVMFRNIKCRKSFLVLFTVFLLFTLSLSACTEAPEADDGGVSSFVPTKIVEGHGSFIQTTLGDLVQNCPTIAYGTILEKSEYVETPEPLTSLSPEEVEDYKRYQRVTMQVEKGLQGCEDGETITYWEAGGISEDGTLFKMDDYDKPEPGSTVLVFVDSDRRTYHSQFQADSEGNVTVFGDYMIEEPCYGNPPATEMPTTELPMEEYLDKVEKVVREQAQ